MSKDASATLTERGSGVSIVRDSPYAWTVVVFLTLVYTVSFIDRQVLNLLVDPIRADLSLNDTQMSLLQGVAFMAAYVAFGPLFGRFADVANRRNILAAGAAVWSIGTVMCGLSSDFWSLFGSRMLVGAAEACVTPAVWSMVADYFSRARLPRAMSIFLIGPYLGSGLALVAGGMVVGSSAQLVETWPVLAGFAAWQVTFIVVGVPGLLLALLMMILVREPARSHPSNGGGDDRHYSLREVTRYLWGERRLFAPMFLALACICIALYAFPAWLPAFLIRQHGGAVSSVGVEYGSLVLLFGTAGVLTGPFIVRWLETHGRPGAAMIAVTACALALIPISIAVPLAPGYKSALMVGAVAAFFYSMPQAITAAALALICPNRMRGVAAAILTFLVSVAGLGVAPTAVALLTDYVFRDPTRVGESLAITSAVATAVAALLAFSALPHYRAAIARADGR